MDAFDTHKWFKKQYLEENVSNNELSQLILQSMNNIDENLSYQDLAIAIADILKNEYGKHNYVPFIKVLRDNLDI